MTVVVDFEEIVPVIFSISARPGNRLGMSSVGDILWMHGLVYDEDHMKCLSSCRLSNQNYWAEKLKNHLGYGDVAFRHHLQRHPTVLV